ncbi:hypothetical protein DRJ00_02985 [Candidatus Aerophobetes bacterium]|uniref:Uroporphyrinogen decarboxylase (URO-D) domain-containing protein n=1 Tax=Aerophobetes bacterium TaxID=2030807 RepID=A0A497E4K5_UNCAE|nr:MAG: hypothetical protein DRJ00_02985 [Candidatus Aerophobetes bacterium]
MGRFSWNVSVVQEMVFPYLAGVRMDEFFLKEESCAKSFRIGREKLKEIFGKEIDNDEITLPQVSGPHLSYGHLACLGAKILFPEDSEPVPKPLYSTIKEAVNALRGKISFEKFFLDLYDHPKLAKKFLELLTQSIVEFVHFIRKLNGHPEIDQERGGLCDDFSSLISPSLWPDFVLPYWEKYYQGTTSGARSIHVENLTPEHLKYLEEINVVLYDPSVSPKLTPDIIRRRISIPFMWRLHSFQVSTMSKQDIRNWVFQTVRRGASYIYTSIDRNTLKADGPEKIRAFIKAAKEAEDD